VGSEDGNIYPTITQRVADLAIPNNICVNLRNLRMDRALMGILENIGV